MDEIRDDNKNTYLLFIDPPVMRVEYFEKNRKKKNDH